MVYTRLDRSTGYIQMDLSTFNLKRESDINRFRICYRFFTQAINYLDFLPTGGAAEEIMLNSMRELVQPMARKIKAIVDGK